MTGQGGSMPQAIRFELTSPEILAPVLHQACEETPAYRGKTTPESAYQGLGKFDCYGIYLAEKLIGGIIFRGDEGHIAVLADFRTRWAGKAFYRFMRMQVMGRGVIQVRCGNPDALPFIKVLERRGFVCLNDS
jgi:hypothetical protein